MIKELITKLKSGSITADLFKTYTKNIQNNPEGLADWVKDILNKLLQKSSMMLRPDNSVGQAKPGEQTNGIDHINKVLEGLIRPLELIESINKSYSRIKKQAECDLVWQALGHLEKKVTLGLENSNNMSDIKVLFEKLDKTLKTLAKIVDILNDYLETNKAKEIIYGAIDANFSNGAANSLPNQQGNPAENFSGNSISNQGAGGAHFGGEIPSNVIAAANACIGAQDVDDVKYDSFCCIDPSGFLKKYDLEFIEKNVRSILEDDSIEDMDERVEKFLEEVILESQLKYCVQKAKDAGQDVGDIDKMSPESKEELLAQLTEEEKEKANAYAIDKITAALVYPFDICSMSDFKDKVTDHLCEGDYFNYYQASIEKISAAAGERSVGDNMPVDESMQRMFNYDYAFKEVENPADLFKDSSQDSISEQLSLQQPVPPDIEIINFTSPSNEDEMPSDNIPTDYMETPSAVIDSDVSIGSEGVEGKIGICKLFGSDEPKDIYTLKLGDNLREAQRQCDNVHKSQFQRKIIFNVQTSPAPQD